MRGLKVSVREIMGAVIVIALNLAIPVSARGGLIAGMWGAKEVAIFMVLPMVDAMILTGWVWVRRSRRRVMGREFLVGFEVTALLVLLVLGCWMCWKPHALAEVIIDYVDPITRSILPPHRKLGVPRYLDRPVFYVVGVLVYLVPQLAVATTGGLLARRVGRTDD
jgi:hypothetical protein